MDKDGLRQKFKVARLVMNPAEVAGKSQVICRNLMNDIDWSKIKSLNIYKPISKLNEVDCSYFIAEVQEWYPRILIDYTSELKTDAPPSRKFDLIIVPVLAFDKDNNRLGWGGGWYDRFLAAQPQALKIGVCFQNGLIEDGIPNQPRDIPLDKIITEV